MKLRARIKQSSASDKRSSTKEMDTLRVFNMRILLAALIVAVLAASASGQTKPARPATDEGEDVVRVNTELVQTDVTVVDKRGRFVEGLRPEQFELRVDGKTRPVSFFERVKAGSSDEVRQLSKARNSNGHAPADNAGTSQTNTSQTNTPERGRVIFFFVDDVHLSPEGVTRSRQALLQFIESGMQQSDRVAIVSTSGRIGFLQQLTDNKAVLREAVARLGNQKLSEVYAGKVPISEYDATQVSDGHNKELFRYLVEATAAEFQTDEMTAANMVKNRVQQIEAQSRAATTGTLSALSGLLHSSAAIAGRKIVFFISDGFVIDPRGSNALEQMRRVTKLAAQVGAVIYTMDARGTFVNIYTDATQNLYPDFTGHVSRDVFAEGQSTEAPLRALAADTGGRAILSSNSFDDAIRRALDESSNYYLLAWRPEQEEQRGEKSRISISIKGHPDLKARVRRGFIESASAVRDGKALDVRKAATPEAELLVALGSLYPVSALPVSLSVGYMSAPEGGTMLAASMQIDAVALNTETGAGVKTEIDVLGVALDDRGSISSFKQTLTVEPYSAARKLVAWNHQMPLAPGLYQVRVAVRERLTGRTGSASQWIEIPRIAAEQFALSSIFIGERRAEDTSASQRIPVSVSRRFARGSFLRYQTYVYNAASANAPADVIVQLQILRDGQPVQTIPASKLPMADAKDPARLSVSGEIALEQLSAGRYVLKVSATDKRTGTIAMQQTDFVVE
jgi:VWFA-related protein